MQSLLKKFLSNKRYALNKGSQPMSIVRGCLTVFVLLLGGLSAALGEELSEELAALQGTWKGTEAGNEKKGTCTLKIDGTALHFQGWNKNEWYKGTLRILPDRKPKQLHGTVKECPVPEFVGKTSLSIYRIEDGTLTLVGRRPGDPEAPTGFKDKKARRFVLKKTPPKKENADE
jgi:uncharacterized protein (TIGR03067 family)